MNKSNSQIVHSFLGDHFEVVVQQCGLPKDQRTCRVLVRVRVSAAEPAKFDDLLECAPHQLHELTIFLKTADAMVQFLREGGCIEHWESYTANPIASRN